MRRHTPSPIVVPFKCLTEQRCPLAKGICVALTKVRNRYPQDKSHPDTRGGEAGFRQAPARLLYYFVKTGPARLEAETNSFPLRRFSQLQRRRLQSIEQ